MELFNRANVLQCFYINMFGMLCRSHVYIIQSLYWSPVKSLVQIYLTNRIESSTYRRRVRNSWVDIIIFWTRCFRRYFPKYARHRFNFVHISAPVTINLIIYEPVTGLLHMNNQFHKSTVFLIK